MKKNYNHPFCFIFFFFISFILSLPLYAQTSSAAGKKTISGVIIDEKTKEPIIGASIVTEKDKTIGTISDYLGKFQLSLPQDINVLQVSYLGYATQRIELKGRSQLEIILQEDVQMISEVVVVGYGTQKKETLTGSISVIGNKELVQTPTANISNALVGRIPGISSIQSSGEPGDNASTIRIRGAATLNDAGNDPLIVIDGIQSTMSTLNALDANEIQNISVLKDASSTAVYGVKGANGVIIVTTKRGESGAPKISLSYRYGVSQLASKLKMLGSYEYALFRNEAIRNDMDTGKNSFIFSDDDLWKFKNNRDYTPSEIASMNLTPEQKTALANSPAFYYSSHDYYAEQFGASSPQQQFNVNISGGGDRMRYFTSVGYFSQDGVFNNSQYAGMNANSSYNRYNVRSNLDIDVVKNLKLSVQFGGQFEDKAGIMGANGTTDSYDRHKEMLVMIFSTPPFRGPGIVDNKLISTFVTNLNPLQSKGGGDYSPAAYLLTRPMLSQNISTLNSTATLKHTMDYLIPGLSVSGTISYNDVYQKGVVTQQWVPTYSAARNPENPNEILFFGGVTQPTNVWENKYNDNELNNKWNQIYLEAKVDYSQTFGKHAVTGLILYNAQKTRDPSLAYNVPAGLLGFAGRATYMYDERYLAEFNIGYNGSENFPPGKRFGVFPAYSLGWIISNEKFFPKNDWLTWVKIRGSYGVVGNDQIGGRRFMYLPNTWAYGGTSPGNGYYFGNTNGSSMDPYYTGSYESTVGNPNVTWERAKKTNIGAEVRLFKDRLSFVGDLFQEKRDNILWYLGTIPGIVAATLPPANIGKVSNKGYEIQLSWSDRINNFNYGISANVSYARNKIEYEDEPSYPYAWMNATGFSLGQYKGFKSEGFYNNDAEASNRPYVSIDGNKVQAGDIRYVDIDGDGVIDANDKVPIGYSNLPQYTFGSTINLGYKGFYATVLFTGSYKGSMPMTSFYILNPFYMTNGAALQFQYDGRWTPEKVAQGIEPTFPRASLRNYDTQNGAMNDLWLRSSQYIKLKNVEIGYNFTKLGSLKRMGLSGVRIYVNGNNLYTWCSKLIDGYDPEQMDSGGASDGYLYPPMKNYNFGVNVQF